MSDDPIMDKMLDNLKKYKEAGMSEKEKKEEKEKEKTIKEEMEAEHKDIEIKITLTEKGYKIDPPMDAGFLREVLYSIREDLFIQQLYGRSDAPWMRKIGISGRKKN